MPNMQNEKTPMPLQEGLVRICRALNERQR